MLRLTRLGHVQGLLIVAALGALAPLAGGAREGPGEKEADRIAGLIRQLGDDQFARREAASRALEAVGEPALEALRKAAASSADPEVRQRASRVFRAILATLQIRRFLGHSDGVIAVALSPDGKRALSGAVCYTSKDSAARLWDVATGKEVRRFEGHSGGVYCVAFSPDGTQAITGGGADKTLRLWDVASGKELKRFTGHTATVYGAAFSPDGKSILSGGADGTVRLWDVEGKELRQFKGHTSWVRAVAFAPDGKRVLSRAIMGDPSVRLWDVKTGKEIRRFLTPLNRVGTWGTAGIAFSPDGKLIAAAGQDHLIRLWDAQSGKEVRRLEGHALEANAVAFTPDGKRLLSGSEDRTVRVWDVRSGKELYRLAGHAHRVWSVACSADGRYALSGSFDRTLRLWRVPR
jgi:WD40 repeat protein